MKFCICLMICVFTFKVCFAQIQWDCTPSYSNAHLDINNIDALIQQGGCLWWDLFLEPGYEVPKGENVHALYASAIWMAGIDEFGQLKEAAQTYRQSGNDFFPGPLDKNGNTNFNQCHNFDRFWKLNKSTIDSFIAGKFGLNIPKDILEWPGRNNPHLLNNVSDLDLAPYVDVNFDSQYNIDDGDYPLINGDQSLWWVFNDYGNYHSETQGVPLQVEVQANAFSYKQNNCLDDVTFYEYKVINKSPVTIDSFFFGQWTTNSLGCWNDDYFGSDSARNMLVSYNGDNFDGPECSINYGSFLPMLAIRFVNGPHDKF
ncbi:MAG: hypothetical protein LH473_05690, partial [Chitinophagales bacterium]|nr:hypothetical protein [Chitinophagales bacterium]